MLKITFTEKKRESVFSASTQMRSMNDLTKVMSRSSSMNSLLGGDLSESDSESNLLSLNRGEQVNPSIARISVFKIYDSMDDLKDKEKLHKLLNVIPQYFKSQSTHAKNVFLVFMLRPTQEHVSLLQKK